MGDSVNESNIGDGQNETKTSVEDASRERRTPFRFKSKSTRESDGSYKRSSQGRKRRKVDGNDGDARDDMRHHRNHRHSTRRQRHHSADEAHEEDEPPNPTYQMDAETAFRESLFDALADDEGAAFWEGVYGQPIHTYPKTKPAEEDGLDGELRHMSDEEYTAYVRQQMWEKSHQHIIEERQRREEAAKRRAEEKRKRAAHVDSERDAFNKKMEESLRRGDARRKERAWREGWAAYVRGWERLLAPRAKSIREDGSETKQERRQIPWPVCSGRAADIGTGEVEAFFEHAAAARDNSRDSLRSLLKTERVRWHPDKMQQRFGHDKMDEATLKKVVAVFQIVDAQFGRL